MMFPVGGFGSFWLFYVLAVAVGIILAMLDDSPPHQGTGPVSHIEECLDSAHTLFGADFWGLGVLDPLRQMFASRPDGVQGIGGIFAVIGSFCAALGGVARAASSAFLCRCRRKKVSKRAQSKVPESTTHERVQLKFSEEMSNYWGYVRLIAIGLFREYLVRFLAKVHGGKLFTDYVAKERWRSGWEDFYKNHCYTYIEHCLHRPVASAPDAKIECVKLTRDGGKFFGPLHKIKAHRNETFSCTNLSSYNYLGFGGVDAFCTPLAKKAALEVGFSTGASRSEGGTIQVHRDLEAEVARFLKKEDAIVLGMGFATNSTILPALFEAQAGSSGVLVLSDALNHRSIVEGVRLSGASVRSFEHNSMVALEERLREAVVNGQDNKGKPWRKIFVVVEGIYSMEGDFCRLREIVALKKKYKAYLYLDEAHSIGAVGPTGRGVTDLLGVPTSEVDIMMGTFTKSFGSAGGYVAASSEVIAALRANAPGMLLASAMAPPCAVQALAALRVITGQEGGDLGAKKLAAIRENSNLFRKRLEDEGFKILGDYDSPIAPMMIHHGFKLRAFSDICIERGIAVVVVGYPVVPLLYERARFCISAAHTRDQINAVVDEIIEIGTKLGILFEKTTSASLLAERKKKDEEYRAWLHEAPLDIGTAPEVENWTPDPLVPTTPITSYGKAALKEVTTVNSFDRLSDFRLQDPLNLATSAPPEVHEAMSQTMAKYGFGACGPRGFYGGMLPHYDLEADLARFCGMTDCIVYSSCGVMASSVLPALIQSGDRVVLDDQAHVVIRAGLRLTKGAVSWYRQGDMRGLEAALATMYEKQQEEKKQKKRSTQREPRTFIVAEGISQRTGAIAPLPELVRLKEKYGAMLLLDETLSLPTLGPRGRGLCDHFRVDTNRVDAIMGSLEHGFGNVGGFCAGRETLVEHQRLAGAGYCYSASSPPSAASGVSAAIRAMDTEFGQERLTKLRQNCSRLHSTLNTASARGSLPLEMLSSEDSPVQHLRWTGDEAIGEETLLQVAQSCADAGMPIQVCRQLACGAEASFNKRIGAATVPGAPTLRAATCALQTPEQIEALGETLASACLAAAAAATATA